MIIGFQATLPTLTVRMIANIVAPLMGIGAAICYYVAFLPPTWVRQAWHLREVYAFVGQLGDLPPKAPIARTLEVLCEATMRGTSAIATAFALPAEEGRSLTIQVADDPRLQSLTMPCDGGLVGRIWHSGEPGIAVAGADLTTQENKILTAIGARSLFAVPLATNDHRWGVLLVAFLGEPLFPMDDLRLLKLFGDNASRMMATRKLVTEQEDLLAQVRRVNTELARATRMKSEFLANMSHELRTPLNAIIGFAELMHDGKAGPVSDMHQEFLGDILTSGRHLLQLINDVLDLSKVEAGKMEFRPVPVDLSRLVGEVRDILRTLAGKNQIRVETQIDPSIDGVVIDPAKLKQVLYNYLSNAIKFTPKEGRVMVRIQPEQGRRFRLEVEDTGIGIAPQDQERLFREFQQLDSGLAKQYQGTGLGLALTKRIVEAQGGRVGVSRRRQEGQASHSLHPLRQRLPRRCGGGRYPSPEQMSVGALRRHHSGPAAAGHERP